MTVRYRPLRPLLFVAMLGGCATAPDGAYPSLAIRDAERVTGRLVPPAAMALVPPPEPSAAALGQFDALQAQAAAAHARFLEAAPGVRAAVVTAAGEAAGSDGWAQAELALAGLQAIRSQAMIALADLDRLYVDAATQGQPLDRVEAVRGTVAAMVEEEDRLIDALAAGAASEPGTDP